MIRVPMPMPNGSSVSRTGGLWARTAGRRPTRTSRSTTSRESVGPMPRIDSTVTTLVIAAALAAAIGYGVNEWTEARKRDQPTSGVAAVAQPAPAKPDWAASAPGRVEPRDGEVRLTAQAPGRVIDVLARVNDRVKAGDVLVLLDEEEARARLAAAEAAESARRRDRDEESVGKAAADRR